MYLGFRDPLPVNSSYFYGLEQTAFDALPGSASPQARRAAAVSHALWRLRAGLLAYVWNELVDQSTAGRSLRTRCRMDGSCA